MVDYRDLLIEFVDEGALDAREALITCLKWMTADDVRMMMNENEYLELCVGVLDNEL